MDPLIPIVGGIVGSFIANHFSKRAVTPLRQAVFAFFLFVIPLGALMLWTGNVGSYAYWIPLLGLLSAIGIYFATKFGAKNKEPKDKAAKSQGTSP